MFETDYDILLKRSLIMMLTTFVRLPFVKTGIVLNVTKTFRNLRQFSLPMGQHIFNYQKLAEGGRGGVRGIAECFTKWKNLFYKCKGLYQFLYTENIALYRKAFKAVT